MWAAAFALGLVVATSLALRSPVLGMRRAAIVLSLNWAGVMAATNATNTYDPWLSFFVLDALCAAIVLSNPATRTHAIIGLIYVFQMTFHLAYVAVGSASAMPLYLDLLALGGWLQIAALSWGALSGGHLARNNLVSGSLSADSSHPHGMG